MAKDKGWGSKTSSDNNYYKLLKDSRKGGHYSSQWTAYKNKK
jgi:hypothetical protein